MEGVFAWGCLPRRCLCPGGVCLRVSPLPHEMATAAVGTHPTGMQLVIRLSILCNGRTFVLIKSTFMLQL